jgi:hypothetical protein
MSIVNFAIIKNLSVNETREKMSAWKKERGKCMMKGKLNHGTK